MIPSLYTVGLFTVGAISCRSAGCIINDLTDRDIDKHVDRTKARPLTTGELSVKQASAFLAALMTLNFSILFQLPAECIKLGFMVTPLVFIYPTTKRFFPYPQAVLGATFNFGVFIGYAALSPAASVAWATCIPFYIGATIWTVIYDSIYAFQDREFDKKLGLRSTAIEMENRPKEVLSALAATSTALFALGGFNAGLTMPFYLGLCGVGAHYAWQISTLDIENRENCWDRFVSNRILGLILTLSIIAGRTFDNEKTEIGKAGDRP